LLMHVEEGGTQGVILNLSFKSSTTENNRGGEKGGRKLPSQLSE